MGGSPALRARAGKGPGGGKGEAPSPDRGARSLARPALPSPDRSARSPGPILRGTLASLLVNRTELRRSVSERAPGTVSSPKRREQGIDS
jgi:hypothetical protein